MIAQQMKAKMKDDGTSVEQTKINMVDSWRLDACAIWNCPSQFWSVMFCRDFYGFFSRIFFVEGQDTAQQMNAKMKRRAIPQTS